MNSRCIPLTDHKGVLLVPEEDTTEPLPGSVILTEGKHGTAWQRMFVDGQWRSTRGGTARSWTELLAKRNVVLVYDAEQRVRA
jgi:hypothetical protein